MSDQNLVELRGIHKAFGDNVVLDTSAVEHMPDSAVGRVRGLESRAGAVAIEAR